MLNVTLDETVERRMEALGLRDARLKERLVHEAVRATLARLEDRELERAEARVEEFFQEALREGSVELTDATWQEILAARPEDLDPNSLAIPPGWPARQA